MESRAVVMLRQLDSSMMFELKLHLALVSHTEAISMIKLDHIINDQCSIELKNSLFMFLTLYALL